MNKILLLLLCLTVNLFSQHKQICFTMDDLPVVNYGINDTAYQNMIVDNIISSFVEYNIPAIGFVNERKLYDENGIIQYRKEMLKKWAVAGLDLGNHTYSHPSYNKVSLKEYGDDILKGEKNTKEILSKNGKELKYFRHPFLHSGNTKEKADSLEEFLANNNYTTAPVTVDNADYLFALAYKRAYDKNDDSLMSKIGNDYVDYMIEKVKYYEGISNKLFGRNINQIILMHASHINADYVDDLAKRLIDLGYGFISLEEAIKDEAYKTEITYFGDWGISWIDRWALSQGKKGDFFKDDPVTPDYIKEMSK